MAVTHTLQATFTQSIGKAISLPAGAKSMFFFGTGGDGFNGNRVVSGNAPIANGTPVYSANYVTVGYNGTTNNTIDTNNQRTSAMLAAGWTWAAVYRLQAGGATGANVIEDTGSAGGALPLVGSANGFQGQNSASLNVFIHSNGQAANKGTHALGTLQSNWHFVAITYTGGAAGTVVLNSFTDNIAGGTPATFAASAIVVGTNSPSLGGMVPNGANTYTVMSDIAWAYIGQGAMIQTDLAALAASVRPWLARRGVVC